MVCFRSQSLPLERKILQLRERAGRKQRGDSDAAASCVQNQVHGPHHCGRVHEGGLDQPSQGMWAREPEDQARRADLRGVSLEGCAQTPARGVQPRPLGPEAPYRMLVGQAWIKSAAVPLPRRQCPGDSVSDWIYEMREDDSSVCAGGRWWSHLSGERECRRGGKDTSSVGYVTFTGRCVETGDWT